jgi:hypothetical protein
MLDFSGACKADVRTPAVLLLGPALVELSIRLVEVAMKRTPLVIVETIAPLIAVGTAVWTRISRRLGALAPLAAVTSFRRLSV